MKWVAGRSEMVGDLEHEASMLRMVQVRVCHGPTLAPPRSTCSGWGIKCGLSAMVSPLTMNVWGRVQLFIKHTSFLPAAGLCTSRVACSWRPYIFSLQFYPMPYVPAFSVAIGVAPLFTGTAHPTARVCGAERRRATLPVADWTHLRPGPHRVGWALASPGAGGAALCPRGGAVSWGRSAA